MSLTDDFTDNTDTPLTDKRQVKERAKKAGNTESRRRATLSALMNVREGRELIYWLLEKCHIDKTSTCVSPNGFDVYGTFFNEGARSVGIMLQAELIAVAPAQMALMLQEEQERQELRKQGNA